MRMLSAVVAVSLLVTGVACRSSHAPTGTTASATATASVTPTPNSATSTAARSTAATRSAGLSTTTAPSSATPITPQSHVSTAPAHLAGREWTAIPTTRHVVALTFDAGANDAGVASILATLRRSGVPATFFLTGNWVQASPADARAICTGYRIGNHSMTHPHFTALTTAKIDAQIHDAASTMRTTCGADPTPLFRFPYGDRDARTIAAVNDIGYVPVAWTVDTLGWEGTSGGGESTSAVTSRVLTHLQPGEIVLMHVGSTPGDGSTLDADALPGMISALREHGYGFVTLDALLR